MRGWGTAGWLLCAALAVGVAGSRAHRAHYERNVHDELCLLLHDVLSRPMSLSDQDRNLNAIAERVRGWRSGQGLNTPDEVSDRSGAWWSPGVYSLPAWLVVACTALLGTALVCRGYIFSGGPFKHAPPREHQALSHSTPIIGCSREAALCASGERAAIVGIDDAAVEHLSEEGRKEQELAIVCSSPSDMELIQVLNDRFQDLKLQPGDTSKKEYAKVCAPSSALPHAPATD